MSEATILLIVQYSIKYGIPAANALIELLNTPNPTPEQVKAAFAVAQTPFDEGLKPGVLKP